MDPNKTNDAIDELEPEVTEAETDTDADEAEETDAVEEDTVDKPAEGDDEPDDEDTEKVPERPVYHMPVKKAEKMRDNAVAKATAELKAKHDAEIAALKAQSGASREQEDVIEKVAGEVGLDPVAAKKLANAILSMVPKVDTSVIESAKQAKALEDQKTAVAAEFDRDVLPLITKRHPNATPEYIRDVKKRVTELAFSKGYNAYRIADIWRVKADDMPFKNGKGAETPRGGTAPGEFRVLSDEEENALAAKDPEKYAKYIAKLDARQRRFN